MADTVSAERSSKEADYNLESQQDAAEWAFGTLLVSIPGVVGGFYGIILVIGTLNTANEANEISREDQRPWIDVAVNVQSLTVFDFGSGPQFDLRVDVAETNKGKSPAVKMLTQPFVSHRTTMQNEHWVNQFLGEIYPARSAKGAGSTLLQEADKSVEWQVTLDTESRPHDAVLAVPGATVSYYLAVVVGYQATWSSKVRYTAPAYLVHMKILPGPLRGKHDSGAVIVAELPGMRQLHYDS